MSDLITRLDCYNEEEISAYISPVPNSTTEVPPGMFKSSIHRRRDILLEFLDILCFPGSRIKIIDISVDVSHFSKVCNIHQ